MNTAVRNCFALLVLSVAGCNTIPTGPSRMALPGTGKSLDLFRTDDAACRQYALENAGVVTSRGSEANAAQSVVAGNPAGDQSSFALQRRYDDGYTQCMYARGHRVAVPGGMVSPPSAPQPSYAPPPPGSAPPPPSSIVR